MRTVRHVLKLALVAALFVVVLVGILGTSRSAHAATAANYHVSVGAALDNGTYVLGFAPQTLKVHRGDTITWQFAPIHDVRFDTKPADLLIVSDIDGKQTPEINPKIAFPSGKSGDPFKAGVGSGIMPSGPGQDSFSMVMDVDPGTYSYLCDLHPGMVGTIIVVDDNTDIPSPADAEKEGKSEMDASINAAAAQYLSLSEKALAAQLLPLKNDTAEVSNGASDGNAVVARYFPSTTVIHVGQSVTWTVPLGLELHTVNYPMPKDNVLPDISVVVDSQKNPHITLPDTYNANVKSGDEVQPDSTVGSGFILPGQSFTLKFPKAGVYNYFCAIHPGQVGTIVVLGQ